MASEQQRAWANHDRGRHPHHWNLPRLTAAQRQEIRERLAAGESAADLAVEYGVTRGAINNYR